MSEEYTEFNCDLCGSSDAEPIEVSRKYLSNNEVIHVCKDCGFVYVRNRRSIDRIAEAWSKEIYQKGYTARIPAVVARQTYVAEFIDSSIGLKGKSVCDIGGGEGQFLDIIRGDQYGAEVFGIEPSEQNCKLMSDAGIDNFEGTIEDYIASGTDKKFDIVTVMWTLENTQDCRGMIGAAHDLLKDGGHLLIATGSRIMVPFKKPLHLYISKNPADTHCFRVSANTLQGLMAVSGFKMAHVNRYIDTDYLTMIGQKSDKSQSIDWQGDDWSKVVDFFNRWDKETSEHYPTEVNPATA
ncbi:class I SAM-dependent methyltransferase [Pseudomonadota bacterium]